MANLSMIAKMQNAQKKTINAEKLDYTPLAILTPQTRKPDTLAQAIERVLGHSMEQEAYERIRGWEYDELAEDDSDFGETDFDADTDTDAGYFADQKLTKTDKNAGIVKKAEFVTPETSNAQANAPQGVGGEQLGKTEELEGE